MANKEAISRLTAKVKDIDITIEEYTLNQVAVMVQGKIVWFDVKSTFLPYCQLVISSIGAAFGLSADEVSDIQDKLSAEIENALGIKEFA